MVSTGAGPPQEDVQGRPGRGWADPRPGSRISEAGERASEKSNGARPTDNDAQLTPTQRPDQVAPSAMDSDQGLSASLRNLVGVNRRSSEHSRATWPR